MDSVRRITTHTFLALLEAALVASLVVVLVAGTTLAGKGTGGKKPGGGSGSGTLTLAMAVDKNGNGTPNWADSVTYKVSTTATTQPYVSTTCKQGSLLVLSTSAGFFASYPWPSAQVVPLKTDRWTGGAADCTAKLYSMDGGSQTILMTISYHVDA